MNRYENPMVTNLNSMFKHFELQAEKQKTPHELAEAIAKIHKDPMDYVHQCMITDQMTEEAIVEIAEEYFTLEEVMKSIIKYLL